MKQIWNWIRNNPNRTMFLVPILLVAGISISHVVTWYDMANPINWAVYLSIAIEVGAMTALVAATNKIKGGVWFMFGLVTFIQMIGNIFYSYVQIDETGELFKNWVELTAPAWEVLGTEVTDIIGLKRWLAFLEGGLLPLISLTSLHFFVKYEKKEEEDKGTPPPKDEPAVDEPAEEPFRVKMSVPEGKEFNVSYPLPLSEEKVEGVKKEELEEIKVDFYGETVADVIDNLEVEKEEEVIREEKKKTVSNKPPKKKMGIDRIQ